MPKKDTRLLVEPCSRITPVSTHEQEQEDAHLKPSSLVEPDAAQLQIDMCRPSQMTELQA